MHLLRERLRITQEEMAQIAGVSSRTIARYEQREKPPGNALICERIAQETGTDLDWLLTGEGAEPAASPRASREAEPLSEDDLAEAMLEGALRYARRLTAEIALFASELKARLDAREEAEVA